MSTERPPRPLVARTVRSLSVFVILGWVAFTLLVTFAVPRLEVVGAQHSVPLAPQDAPAVQAMQHMGRVFKESNSDSFAMLVLEGQQPLGDEAHAYYNRLIRELRADNKHVEHVQDLWSDRLTAAGAQSPDGKAAYVQFNLAGNQGTTLGQDSVASVRSIIAHTPAPPGITAYVTGPSALLSDMQSAGDNSILKITAIGALIIFLVLLVVYRSVATVILLLLTVATEVFAARGIVAFLGDHNLVGLSTFATNLLVALAMAAGTDYGIFFFGRYQEARQAGEDRETAYFTTYRSVSPVVLGSGLTIAGAMLCLSFTRMPIFQTVGVPCAVGMFASVLIALTLAPAVLTIGSGFGLLDPRHRITVRGWRRVGTAIVRWPAPILAASTAIALVGIATLPGYKTSYNDRLYMPKNIPANVGYDAADRHFSQSRMMPEIVMVEA
ncbi:MAG TPA: MMPL family transporter, partial [Mycobacterium sp.]